MRLELRAIPSTRMVFASPVIALFVTMLVGVILFTVLGKDPLKGLSLFFYEPLKNTYRLTELSIKATPLVLCALGLSVCYRANVWNIGAEGQLLLGAVCASGVALLADKTSTNLYFVLPILAGIIGGMFWASITAWLRDQFNANEILVSLMLVYVAYFLVNFLVYGPWKDPNGFNFPQTASFAKPAMAPLLTDVVVPGSRMNIGFVVALIAIIGVTVFMSRSFAGFQLQVGGLAPAAARYAGYSSRRALWTALLVSGGFAGLAGAFEAIGPLGQLTPHVSTGYGFGAIIVAFVGRLHPVGILFSAALLSMFYIGGELAQSRLGLPSSITGVFQGLLLFSLLVSDTFIRYRLNVEGSNKNKLAHKKVGNA
jgi:general nucleoside transport system permease protein